MIRPTMLLKSALIAGLALFLACASTSHSTHGRRSKGQSQDFIQAFQVGVMHLNQGHLKEAQKSFRELAATAPDNAPVWNNLGKAYMLDKNTIQAEQAFREAIKLVPSFADAHNNLGVLYMQEEKWDQAEKELVLAQQDTAYRQSPITWENLGILNQKRGDCGKAIQYFTESLRRNEKHSPSLLHRGECYEELGHPSEALKDYEKALDEKPDDIRILFRIGRTLVKLGRYGEARKLLERVTLLAPTSPEAKEAASILKTIP